MDAPKKYTKINGIMKLNPEYKRWKDAQAANTSAATGAPPAATTTVLHSSQALPIVSSMEDHMSLNEDLKEDIPFAESTNATIEMLQEPEIAAEAGLAADDMIDELGKLLTKYEIPIGLTNKLMGLSEYASLEFIVDDSGSMTLNTDSKNPRTKQPITRWAEAQILLKEMIEVIAYVPFEQIGIEFLNRQERITLKREMRSPGEFLADANQRIDQIFATQPYGTTPALEKLQESFLRGQGVNIARYFFGDGKPNGGQSAVDEICKILMHRPNPEGNPVTFLSCTDEDEAVEWMKDAEEIAPYCSETDDFQDEAREVLKDQGVALPFSKGFHLICALVGAMNPDDLDAMDECVPFTKFTLDNLLGIVSNEASYKHYFDSFVAAQANRVVEVNYHTGQPSRLDTIRKNTRWNFSDFLSMNGPARKIPQVAEVKKQLREASGY